jgi:hypothetical protein
LAIADVGAYGMSMASTYNSFDLPDEIWLSWINGISSVISRLFRWMWTESGTKFSQPAPLNVVRHP